MDGVVILDVFASPAVPVLLDLKARGVPVVLDAGRIKIGTGVTDDELAVLRAHRDDVKTWLGTQDSGVEARRAAFESELKARGAFTGYLYRQDVPLVRGSCFSCGDGLPKNEFARCWRCRLAWRLARGAPVVSSEYADAVDTARRSG